MNQENIKNIISKMRVSDTPKTDKILATELHGPYQQDRMFDMLKEHARRLERELQTAKEYGYNQGFREGLAFKGKP
jgi:hypothetical protein